MLLSNNRQLPVYHMLNSAVRQYGRLSQRQLGFLLTSVASLLRHVYFVFVVLYVASCLFQTSYEVQDILKVAIKRMALGRQ